MQENGKVSVLIPYYNDSLYIEESIKSVLNQRYSNFELILINNCCTDNSRAIAHSFNDIRIIHIDVNKNQGAGGGDLFEILRKVMTGDYIKLFCADDVMSDTCLEVMVNKISNFDILFCNVEYIDSSGKSLNDTWFTNRLFFRKDLSKYQILDLMVNKGVSILPYPGCFIKKRALENIFFDHSTIHMFDMTLFASILLNMPGEIGFIDETLVRYRVHDNQASSLNNKNRALFRSNFESSSFYMCFIHTENIEAIKYVFRNSKYISLLDNPKDIEFIVYQYFFEKQRSQLFYFLLHNLLEDDEVRSYLVEHFNYDVLDLRNSVDNFFQDEEIKKKDWKYRTYNNCSSELSFFQLLYLFIRRVYKTIIGKRSDKNKSKEYTV